MQRKKKAERKQQSIEISLRKPTVGLLDKDFK